MIEPFESIISTLIRPRGEKDSFFVLDPLNHLDEDRTDSAGVAQALNAAFLITLAGGLHPAFERAKRFLDFRVDASGVWKFSGHS